MEELPSDCPLRVDEDCPSSSVVARVEGVENGMLELTTLLSKRNEELGEILEWIRSAKSGARFLSHFFAALGATLIATGKVVAAMAVLYGFFELLMHGKPPDIKTLGGIISSGSVVILSRKKGSKDVS